MKVEIYFHDLTKAKQDEVLKLYGVSDPAEGNFDYAPLTILEYYGE